MRHETRRFAAMITLMTALHGCGGEEPAQDVEAEEFEVVYARQELGPGASIDQAAVSRLRVANTHSAALVYRKLRELQGDEGFVFSPFSLSRALSFYYEPNHRFSAAYEGLFGFTPESTSLTAWLMTSQLAMERDTPPDTPASERSTFMSADIQWIDEVDGVASQKFDLVHALPIKADSDRARGIINAWIEKRSGGLLTDFLDPNTQLSDEVTTNVLFFTGAWSASFKKSGDITFDTPSGTKTLPAFGSDETTFIQVDLRDDVSIIPLRFAQNYSFVVLMPKGDLAAFDDTLDQPTLDALLTGPFDDEVGVVLPTIDLKTTPPLQKGLYELSDENGWGLGLPESTLTGAYLETFIQKARIEVDHKGARAAAATVVTTADNNSSGPETTIEVNKPFVYLIKDNVSGNVLFMGAFTGE